MAAPVVTGIAGLLKSARPDWDWVKLRKAIVNSCDPINHLNPGYAGKLGAGRVNAYKALRQTVSPAAASDLEANAVGATFINLKWDDNSDNELQFKIFRSLTPSGGFSKIGVLARDDEEGDLEYYQDSGLLPDTTYYYRVKANNTGGNSAFSNTASATTYDDEPPVKPQGLTAWAVSSTQVNLSWADVDNEEGYKIDRKEEGGTWEPLATKEKDDTTHGDGTVKDGTRYYYRVRAYNDFGYSPWSNAASAITPLQEPTNLAAEGSCFEVQLNWQDNSEREDGFKVERKSGAAYYPIDTVARGVTRYTDVDLPCGQTFYYRVRAYNSLVDSAYTNAAAAKMASCSTCGYGMVLKITSDKKRVRPGETVTYIYEVKNKSRGDLSDIRLIDTASGLEIASILSLERGRSVKLSRSVTARETATIFARAEGRYEEEDTAGVVEANGCATVEVEER
jgi:uncharacterized repeat protein (TIGR01451 family)